MTEALLDRTVLLAVVVAVVVLVTLALRRWNARRIVDVRAQVPNWHALGVAPDGRRTVVAFSTLSCGACHTAQSPAIDQARAALSGLDIRRIDVDTSRQPDAARAFGILTVPSTVVIAAEGRQIVAVNQGFATSSQLVEQLRRF